MFARPCRHDREFMDPDTLAVNRAIRSFAITAGTTLGVVALTGVAITIKIRRHNNTPND